MSHQSRSELPTELAYPGAEHLDRMPLEAQLELFAKADLEAASALEAARPMLAAAVELITAKLANGGRWIYYGAGTSGRLACLDAAELPPTFASDPETVQAVIAGGPQALTHSIEGAEDDGEAARRDVEQRQVGPKDVVFGIAASGTTTFVHAALEAARARAAATIFLACVPKQAADDQADISIRLDTGPELIRGSTRLKAGSATKMALNTISSLVMVRLGKVYGQRMVDLAAGSNVKLKDRAERIVMEIAGIERERAASLLQAAGGQAKLAALMGSKSLERPAAEDLLKQAKGFLDEALRLA